MKTSLDSWGFRAFVATMFLGAMNDNAFKLIVSLLAVALVPPEAKGFYTGLAAGLFILPFLLFSSYAGFLADRWSKKTVMVWAKAGEIVIMVLGGVAFYAKSVPFMVVVLFCMGAQSALFGPAKLGFLPEAVEDRDLSRANGMVQMWTFFAIIIGTVVGGWLAVQFKGQIYLASGIFVLIAVVGTVTSLYMTPVTPAAEGKRMRLNFVAEHWANMVEIGRNRALFLCVIGTAFFWSLGALYQLNALLYTPEMMGHGDRETSILLGAAALGIGLGSVLAGLWSGGKVEFGLVPLGTVGLGLASVGLWVSHGSMWLTGALFLGFGVAAGLYSVPLNAFIQQESPADGKGRILATASFVANLGILAASLVFGELHDRLGLDPAQIFLVAALVTLPAIVYTAWLLPDALLRFVVWLVARLFYRVRVVGDEHLPREGGALLIANHTSFADGAVIQACTQRFVRFLMEDRYCRMPGLRRLCRIMRVVPISAQDDAAVNAKALRRAAAMVRAGELVCVFAEGAVTRTGNLLPFRGELGELLDSVRAPVVPVYIDQMWGSIFSFEGGRLLNRLPARLPYEVTVSFGAPMTGAVTLPAVRSAVGRLGADSYGQRRCRSLSLFARVLRQARRGPGRFAVGEPGRRLSRGRMVAEAMAMARQPALREGTGPVAVVLRPGVEAVLVNLALAAAGRCAVNLDPELDDGTLAGRLREAAARTVVTAPAETGRFRTEEGEAPEVIAVDALRGAAGPGLWLAMRWLPEALLRPRWPGLAVAGTDAAAILFDTARDGVCRGIRLSHENIGANCEGVYQVLRADHGDIFAGALPLGWSLGLTATVWLPLTAGLGAAFHGDRADVAGLARLVEEFGATTLVAVPEMVPAMTAVCEPASLGTLRQVFVGAGVVEAADREAFRERFGVAPLQGYGITELSPVVAVNVPDAEGGRGVQTGAKRGTVGHPLPNVAVKVVDDTSGEEVPPGKEGQFLVRGPNVMLGYLGAESATGAAMADGWLRTGTRGTVDDDGFLRLAADNRQSA